MSRDVKSAKELRIRIDTAFLEKNRAIQGIVTGFLASSMYMIVTVFKLERVLFAYSFFTIAVVSIFLPEVRYLLVAH